MFCMDLNCLSVSGSSAARTTTVSATIEAPQPIPTVSWKNLRIASKKSISGWRTLAKKTTGQECGESGVRGSGRRKSVCADTGSYPPWLNGLQRSRRQAARTAPRSMP